MYDTHIEFKPGYRYTFDKRAYLIACALSIHTNISEFKFDGSDKLAWYNWLDGKEVVVNDLGGYIEYQYGSSLQRFEAVASWCIPVKISDGVL